MSSDLQNRVLNLSFYIFTPLSDLEEWKKKIQAALGSFSIKGTLLLAPEGMNGFLAGERNHVEASLLALKSFAPFSEIEAKASDSDFVPFDKFTIKIRPEIVTFGVNELCPPKALGKRISAEDLAAWYQSGEDFVILDTRNEYEFRLGAFEGAKSLQIDHFVEFAEAVKPALEQWKGKKIVTYCTGGIRCEKAAPYIASLGHEEVYQLDGGILRYFEKHGGKNWQGECFVFDQRIALFPNLEATGARLCEHCQGPIPKGSTCIHCGA